MTPIKRLELTTPEARATDVGQRAAALTEVLLRTGTFPNIELFVATAVLYMRTRHYAPTSMSVNDNELLAVMRAAAKRSGFHESLEELLWIPTSTSAYVN